MVTLNELVILLRCLKASSWKRKNLNVTGLVCATKYLSCNSSVRICWKFLVKVNRVSELNIATILFCRGKEFTFALETSVQAAK